MSCCGDHPNLVGQMGCMVQSGILAWYSTSTTPPYIYNLLSTDSANPTQIPAGLVRLQMMFSYKCPQTMGVGCEWCDTYILADSFGHEVKDNQYHNLLCNGDWGFSELNPANQTLTKQNYTLKGYMDQGNCVNPPLANPTTFYFEGV